MSAHATAEAPDAEWVRSPATDDVYFWQRGWLRDVSLTRVVAIVAVSSLALNVIGYWFVSSRLLNTESAPSPEIPLGTYRFAARDTSPGVVGAQFNLYVTLSRDLEATGRPRVAAAEHRIRQQVEELLRRAQGADFEDPALAELKRQMQEQINEALGTRAVSSVIVTDLAIRRWPTRDGDRDVRAGQPNDSAPPPSSASARDASHD